jgi:hypothetical protein
VVMGSYGKILRGTGRYLKLAFKPLLYVIIPITVLIVQLDRCLGSIALQRNVPFLLTVRATGTDVLNGISLELPPEITVTAPPVRIPAENEIVWRLAAAADGEYEARITAGGQSVEKTVRVSSDLARVSSVHLRGRFWERIFTSGEAALPQNSPIDSISINYPERNIEIAGYEINWIWLFFILSMVAGFLFKELLGIQI